MEQGHVPIILQALSSVCCDNKYVCKEEIQEMPQTLEWSALSMQYDRAIV